jgi:hypothetical protein
VIKTQRHATRFRSKKGVMEIDSFPLDKKNIHTDLLKNEC